MKLLRYAALFAGLLMASSKGYAAGGIDAESGFNAGLGQIRADLVHSIAELQFPRAKFKNLADETVIQGNAVRDRFIILRDRTCRGNNAACIPGMRGLADDFSRLSGVLVDFNGFLAVSASPQSIVSLTEAEKAVLLRDLSTTLRSLGFSVVGLDNLLNMKWGSYWRRRRIDDAQEQLFRAVERFDAERRIFADRAAGLVKALRR